MTGPSTASAIRPLPFAALALSVVLWSTAYVGSDLVLETGSAAVLSVLRFAIALVVLVPLALRRPGFRRALRSPRTILLGATGVTFYYSFANVGLTLTTPGTAALASAALPVLTAAAAVLLLRERLPRRTVAGLALGTVGVVLIASAGLRLDLGLVLNLVALASYAIYTVLLRRDAERDAARGTAPLDALSLATATAIWGTALMLPWLAVEAATGAARLPTDTPGIVALLALALLVTAPTMVLFNFGAERLPAAISGVATAGIPAIGYALSVALGETLDPVKAIGGVIALAGIVVATLATPSVEPSPAGALVADDDARDVAAEEGP